MKNLISEYMKKPATKIQSEAKLDIKFDEKDIKKSFDNLVTALRGNKTKIDSMNRTLVEIQNNLPNKQNLFDEIRKMLIGHENRIQELFLESTEPFKMSQVINKLLKDKDTIISNLTDEKETAGKDIEVLTDKNLRRKDKIEELESNKDNQVTGFKKIENEKEHLQKKVESFERAQKDQREKFKLLYTELGDAKIDQKVLSQIIETLNMLDDISDFKEMYPNRTNYIIDNIFEQKFAVLLGRMIARCGIEENGPHTPLIKEVNDHLHTYEIIPPQKIWENCAVNYDLERTTEGGDDDPAIFIEKYLTLTVRNKELKGTVIKALVNAK